MLEPVVVVAVAVLAVALAVALAAALAVALAVALVVGQLVLVLQPVARCKPCYRGSVRKKAGRW